MGFRATAIAVLVAVTLWGLVLATGGRRAEVPAGAGSTTLATAPREVTAISVSAEVGTAALERTPAGWVVTGGGSGGARPWPADEQGVRGLLRVLSTAPLSALDEGGARSDSNEPTRRVTIRQTDGRRELTIAQTRLGTAYAGRLDGTPVRVDAGLAEMLRVDAILGMRDKAVFDRTGTWTAITIEGTGAALSLERADGVWRLAEDARSGVRLDQARLRTLLETLQTLAFERHVAEPDDFPESGAITITARGVDQDGEISQTRQRVAIGPQADLAGNAVLLRAERGGASVVGELLTERFPALPTEPTPLLDPRALPPDPARVRDLLVRSPEGAGQPPASLRREGGSWRSGLGIIRRADADLIEALLQTLASDAAVPSMTGAPLGDDPGGLTLDLALADGGRAVFLVSNDEQRVALSDGTVTWRYEGDAALRVADGVRTIRALAALSPDRGVADD